METVATPPIISVQNLVYRYGRHSVFSDWSLNFEEGSTTALLGPNGCGKTTLLRCLVGAATPNRGKVLVKGNNMASDIQRMQASGKIGFAPQLPDIDRTERVDDFLMYGAWLKRVSRNNWRNEVERVLNATALTKNGKNRIGKLSGGMRQRLILAQALLGDPEILVLDEPTVGLDPVERSRLTNALRVQKDKTILFSTHLTEDVVALCDRLVVVGNRQIRFDGDLHRAFSEPVTAESLHKFYLHLNVE